MWDPRWDSRDNRSFWGRRWGEPYGYRPPRRRPSLARAALLALIVMALLVVAASLA